jgi:5-formyltetrahydrofolate cyclo-ligase
MTKADLRKRMKTVLGRVGERELADRGRTAARLLEATKAWKAADLVLAFLSMPGEIDTAPVLEAARRAGKAVAVPRIEGDRLGFRLMPPGPGPLPRDRWGIPVPDASWPELPVAGAGRILMVTPGLAFDRQGNRLGRGRGYYDRFLAEAGAAWAGRFTAIGFCLSEQVVDSVPTDGRDRRVDGIVSDAETLGFT